MNLSKNPWSWVPSLYFAEGIPYVAVMTIALVLYKQLGLESFHRPYKDKALVDYLYADSHRSRFWWCCLHYSY